MIWLPIRIMPGVLKAVNTSCGETRSETKIIIITGTVISIMLCIPYNPSTYLCFQNNSQNNRHRYWQSLTQSECACSINVNGYYWTNQKNLELNWIERSHIVEWSPVRSVSLVCFSLIVPISFCFVCLTLSFVLKLAAEVFVIHHLPLISWTNTCFAFPGWYYAINNCFLSTLASRLFKCYLHYGSYFRSLIIESKQGLIRIFAVLQIIYCLFLHNIPYSISTTYFLSD